MNKAIIDFYNQFRTTPGNETTEAVIHGLRLLNQEHAAYAILSALDDDDLRYLADEIKRHLKREDAA